MMKRHYKITRIIVCLITLIPLSSCATFRTNLDQACVEQFASSYPAPESSRFILPWKVGESYTLTQGNCTLESHNKVDKQHMAFDFKMPIGTAVHAVEDGRIALVITDYKDTLDNGFLEANHIGIEHEGGIITWYMHLKHDGSVVKVDDEVSRGDVIGYSGNTGSSAYPHLHFYAQQLTEECHNAETKTANLALCPTIPISFLNVSPSKTVLEEFVSYTALPY